MGFAIPVWAQKTAPYDTAEAYRVINDRLALYMPKTIRIGTEPWNPNNLMDGFIQHLPPAERKRANRSLKYQPFIDWDSLRLPPTVKMIHDDTSSRTVYSFPIFYSDTKCLIWEVYICGGLCGYAECFQMTKKNGRWRATPIIGRYGIPMVDF